MIKLGEIQELEIKRFAAVGAYLNVEDSDGDDVLLPKSQVPKDAEKGDIIEVFVYRDSKDRVIATTRRPRLTIGQMGHLAVADTSKVGAFLDWGLEKDLFLPFAETVGAVEKGKQYLVGVYLDKSDRLCATMKVRNLLSTDSPYKENNITTGTIYSLNRDIGAFVAVDDKYDGLIPKKEILGAYEVGEVVEVRINKVLEDGKLDLSLRDRDYIQMDSDSKTIVAKLKEKGGSLNLHDKSSPEEINKELKKSKAGFKRAIANLYKEKIIEITKDGISLK